VTFSLLGADRATGEAGIVISSSSPAVAARCAYVRAGVGVASTQNVTDPRLGPRLLDALAAGNDPATALARVRDDAPHIEYRQLAVLDLAGRSAAWSGERTLGVHGVRSGHACVAAGNLLAGVDVLDALVDGFERTTGSLPTRLLAAADAGARAGGEAGPLHSAGLLVAREVSWPVVDLRIDHSEDPIVDLRKLWTLYEPLCEDYIVRALDPGRAPAYGVAGEETRG
jgi:uncharacterized Ntn-hydrolase superfamily protein